MFWLEDNPCDIIMYHTVLNFWRVLRALYQEWLYKKFSIKEFV